MPANPFPVADGCVQRSVPSFRACPSGRASRHVTQRTRGCRPRGSARGGPGCARPERRTTGDDVRDPPETPRLGDYRRRGVVLGGSSRPDTGGAQMEVGAPRRNRTFNLLIESQFRGGPKNSSCPLYFVPDRAPRGGQQAPRPGPALWASHHPASVPRVFSRPVMNDPG